MIQALRVLARNREDWDIPASRLQVRRVNIILSQIAKMKRTERLLLLERIFGRPFDSSSELYCGEASIFISASYNPATHALLVNLILDQVA